MKVPPQWKLKPTKKPSAKPLIMFRKLMGHITGSTPLDRTTMIALGLLTIVIQWDG